MFHGHGNCLASFGAITDEFDGFSLRLGVLNELFEPSSLDEEFDCIFQVDVIVCDESIISVFNIIFESILFIFDFVLFNIVSFLELFYFNCKLFNFRNKYSKD